MRHGGYTNARGHLTESLVGMCKQAETTVSCNPAAVGWARRWAVEEMASVYAAAREVSLDVQTVVSELATNALQAGCGRFTMALDAHHSYLRIAVRDDAPGDPVMQRPSPDRAHGRGLLIVNALSTRWGVERVPQGKTVWADFALSADAEPTFACAD